MNPPPIVLIVEDNPTNLKLVADVLEHDGYIVWRANDAEQALAILKQSTPSLILMDLQLPGMDGLTLARTLRANPAFGAIPIIALTACAFREDERRAYEAGCDGFITKPVDTRSLGTQLAVHLVGDPGATGDRNLPQRRAASSEPGLQKRDRSPGTAQRR